MKILVTGYNGFLGKNLVPFLEGDVQLNTSDLRDKNNCKNAVKGKDIVIHLAANAGGIGWNKMYPGSLFYDNMIMGLHLIEESYRAGVKKFIQIGTVCSYPINPPKIPFQENDLWNGYPEPTNAAYGIAKKALLVMGQAYRQQYGFNSIHLLPANMYGPHDHFDEPNKSHVIPALIKKFTDAKEQGSKSVEIWGSGKVTREFLYVEDCAKAIILAMKKYNGIEPINIGTGEDISIFHLVNIIQELVGYKGTLSWNESKPEGQPKRRLDTTKAKICLEFTAQTSLEEGLKKTIDWYNSVRREKYICQ